MNLFLNPRDRIAEVVKTDTSSGATLSTETHLHDAANNVISQTLEGVTTTFGYDRNRLLTAATGGQAAAYNYDPFGRLDTVTAAGEVLERYEYDGFDRIAEHRKTTDTGATETTTYGYDPLDRTTSRTDNVGDAGEETTDFAYLGLSGEVLSEEVAGEVQKSYQYSPWGQRLSQVKHNGDGTEEEGFYGYNPHTDVETLTDETGDTTATYGYTAYGQNDTEEFTGADKPDPQEPGAEPYNVYRFNAKRWDQASGSYDMGFRDYNPGLNRFLSRDMYTGALADLNLTANPWNNNRYAFAGGNPITGIELDGHGYCDLHACTGDGATGQLRPSSVENSTGGSGSYPAFDLPGIERPEYELPGIERPGGPIGVPEQMGVNSVGNSKFSYYYLVADARSYTGLGGARAPTGPGQHQWNPRHKLDKIVQWGRALDTGWVRGGLRGVPVVGAGISVATTSRRTNQPGAHSSRPAWRSASVPASPSLLVVFALGCGLAIAGGAALTAWFADDLGESFANSRPAKCGTTGHPSVAGRDPRQVASEAPDASTEPAATRHDHTLASSHRGSPSRDGGGVKARSPALTPPPGTRTITRPDDAGPKPDNPYGLARRCIGDRETTSLRIRAERGSG